MEYLDADIATVMANYDVILVNDSNIGIPARDKLSINVYDEYGKLMYSKIPKLSEYHIYIESYENTRFLLLQQKMDNSSVFENANIKFIDEANEPVVDLRRITNLGNRDLRERNKLIGAGMNTKSNVAKGAGVAILAVEGLHLWYWWSSNKDIKTIKEHHAIMIEKVLPTIQKALHKGGYIPSHLQDEFSLGLIANVILYGGDKGHEDIYTKEIMDVGIRIWNELAPKTKKSKSKGNLKDELKKGLSPDAWKHFMTK